MRAILTNARTPVKLVFSLLVIITSWLIFQLLAIFSGMMIFSMDFESAMRVLSDIHDPSGINFIKYVQAITSIGLFIISSLFIAWISDPDPADFLRLKKMPDMPVISLVMLLVIIILPFSNLMTELNGKLELSGFLEKLQTFLENKEMEVEELMKGFLHVKGIPAFFINVIVVALLPAIGEELIFRGVFQKLFISLFKNMHWGIIITAFIFSALHLQFLSFLPRFILGIIFGYLVVWSHSLWPAIIAHFLNNLLAVIYYQLHYNGKIGNEPEMIGSPGYGLYLGFLSLMISMGIIYLIFRKTTDKKDLRSNYTDTN